MKVLLTLVSVSAIIAGTFAQAGSWDNWKNIQALVNDTVLIVHSRIDEVGKLATTASPIVGAAIVESLKTSLRKTIDPVLTELVNAAMNETLTKELIETQREVLRKLLVNAYQQLLKIMKPLPLEVGEKMHAIFMDLEKFVIEQVSDIMDFL